MLLMIRRSMIALLLCCSVAAAAAPSASVRSLEKQFERQINAYFLTSPAKDNAQRTLQALKAVSPNHRLLQRGPKLIAARYVALAKKSLQKARRAAAQKYTDKALSFDPKHSQALQLQAQLSLPSPQQLAKLGNGMVPIPAGCFRMGSPEQEQHRSAGERQHDVCLGSFAIGKHEVTYAQFDRYSDATGLPRLPDQGWGRRNRPVSSISWQQASGYAKWLSTQTGAQYRLPTEAEWEYAARANSDFAFHTGDKLTRRQANINADNHNYAPRGKTQPVGRFPANRWGLFDVHGNVWEWTCSTYSRDYDGKNEQRCQSEAESSTRVLRGGSWYSRPSQTRVAYRGTALYADTNRGFRLVQEL